jgi:hypothetical protein
MANGCVLRYGNRRFYREKWKVRIFFGHIQDHLYSQTRRVGNLLENPRILLQTVLNFITTRLTTRLLKVDELTRFYDHHSFILIGK